MKIQVEFGKEVCFSSSEKKFQLLTRREWFWITLISLRDQFESFPEISISSHQTQNKKIASSRHFSSIAVAWSTWFISTGSFEVLVAAVLINHCVSIWCIKLIFAQRCSRLFCSNSLISSRISTTDETKQRSHNNCWSPSCSTSCCCFGSIRSIII